MAALRTDVWRAVNEITMCIGGVAGFRTSESLKASVVSLRIGAELQLSKDEVLRQPPVGIVK
jgi:hypothetical protein